MLTDEEFLVANRLRELIHTQGIRDRNITISWSLILGIVPKFWKSLGGHYVTLHPISVYRPLYYVSSPSDYVGKGTRSTIMSLAAHLEGLLALLAPDPAMKRLPFGSLTKTLMNLTLLRQDLALDLLEYNRAVNIPAKHPNANPLLQERLNIRTFTIWDAVLCLLVTRRLAIDLFKILESKGVVLPAS